MTHSKQCRELLAHLSDYVDGALENQQLCQEIESHLQGCANCQIMVNTLKKTITITHISARQTALPEEAKKRLIQRLDRELFLD